MDALNDARAYFRELNHAYSVVHKAKEDSLWATYMGVTDDAVVMARTESAYKSFISDPEKLATTRHHVAELTALPSSEGRDALLHGLLGWQSLFEAHIVDSEKGRTLMRDIIDAEAALFSEKQRLQPRHINERGESEIATLAMLGVNQTTNPVEERRRSSFEALRDIERWVLDHGFLDLVKLRNAFARAVGSRNYFEFKLRKTERMPVDRLLHLFDDFVRRTEGANARMLAGLRARHGDQAAQPWNLRFLTSGDVLRRMDEFMPFALALRRWVQTFRHLGVQFHGATLQLDLMERAGKYQNGFCHGPTPAWMDEGAWVPAHINFTSLAKPDQTGSGVTGIRTLFHEGGHAAQMANAVQNAPCFSQEYAPSSMAWLETQSMFCDSLLQDVDWLWRYARNAAGDAMPPPLLRDWVASLQTMRAFDERALAVVPYFEMALYDLPESELTPDAVLSLARATETRLLGIESPRPLLAIPHLLNQESAASYQGYLLAHMAVWQTRAFFLRRDGYLTDNAAIGPALATHYWAPGNSVDHDTTLRSLTGEGFASRYLADECNLSSEDAWTRAQAALVAAAARPIADVRDATLNAQIRVVHGRDVLADSTNGEEDMCSRFETWVRTHYPATPDLS